MQPVTGPVGSAPATKAPAWPTPPYFRQAAAPVPGEEQHCSIELMDGRIFNGALHGFSPGVASVDLGSADGQGRHSFALDAIRVIRLTAAFDLRRDFHVLESVGSDGSQFDEETSFAVRFRDGKSMDGSTRGFLKSRDGLFLYLPERENRLVLRAFIPAQQVDDFRIGPPLGGALEETGEISSDALLAALNKQSRLRGDRLGEQLMDRGIVSQDELMRALSLHVNHPSMTVGDLLVDAGLVSAAQLAEALELQLADRTLRVGDILVEMGAVTERAVQMALSKKLGIPFVNLREFRINPLVLELVNPSFASHYQVLPLLRLPSGLVVAMEDPLSMDFAHELEFIVKQRIVPVIADPIELRARIAKEYAGFDIGGSSSAGARADYLAKGMQDMNLRRANVEELTQALSRDAPRQEADAQVGDSDPRVSENALVRLTNKIILEAHAQGASDIHIESNAGRANTRIRFRKDGELEDYLELQPAYRGALVSRIKVMANLDISEHRHAQDGKIDFGRYNVLQIELRVAVVPTANGMEDVVLRILGGVEPLPLEKLGLCNVDLANIQEMVSRSYGLFLVCGPTGSGKTTTLHSVLHTINQPDIKIWTAEDPVEITQAGLRQVQINTPIGWTFAAAMRAFLRADPDVIMVGEMRDVETTKIGIEASLTGHLVFSTLHTNSAAESVVRLLELGMDPFNFSDALIGILSQRLARKLCPKCKRARPASEAEILSLAQEYCEGSVQEPPAVIARWREWYAKDGPLMLHEAVGCPECKGGLKGRLGVYELLPGSPEVKDTIRSRGSVPQVLDASERSGMRLLRQDAIEKVLEGLLDLPSARSATT